MKTSIQSIIDYHIMFNAFFGFYLTRDVQVQRALCASAHPWRDPRVSDPAHPARQGRHRDPAREVQGRDEFFFY